MTTRNDIPLFDVAVAPLDEAAALAALAEHGFIVLRGLFAPDALAEANARIDRLASVPAVAGVPGYNKVDHPKKLMSPFVAGGALVPMCLDERVIGLVETYMASECVLAEANVKIDAGVGYTYFDMHADFSEGWRKTADAETALTADDMKQPVGVGAAVYMHDTAEGAFSYCAGTHKMMAPRGPDLSAYPADERRSIMDKRVRVDGRAGDLVLFDDRGFHGPDQPCRKSRRVILLDYYRVATFGHTQVSPMQVWSNDLGGLSPRQLRVLGVGADYMVAPQDYMGTRFRRSGMYRPVRMLIENAYLWHHFKQKIKASLRGGARR